MEYVERIPRKKRQLYCGIIHLSSHRVGPRGPILGLPSTLHSHKVDSILEDVRIAVLHVLIGCLSHSVLFNAVTMLGQTDIVKQSMLSSETRVVFSIHQESKLQPVGQPLRNWEMCVKPLFCYPRAKEKCQYQLYRLSN